MTQPMNPPQPCEPILDLVRPESRGFPTRPKPTRPVQTDPPWSEFLAESPTRVKHGWAVLVHDIDLGCVTNMGIYRWRRRAVKRGYAIRRCYPAPKRVEIRRV